MKKWPHIPDLAGLTLEQIVDHPIFAPWPGTGDVASDEEIAYSAGCSVEEVQALRVRRMAAKTRTATDARPSTKRVEVSSDDKPWLKIAPASDREIYADQRRHEDGEPWEDSDAY